MGKPYLNFHATKQYFSQTYEKIINATAMINDVENIISTTGNMFGNDSQFNTLLILEKNVLH